MPQDVPKQIPKVKTMGWTKQCNYAPGAAICIPVASTWPLHALPTPKRTSKMVLKPQNYIKMVTLSTKRSTDTCRRQA